MSLNCVISRYDSVLELSIILSVTTGCDDDEVSHDFFESTSELHLTTRDAILFEYVDILIVVEMRENTIDSHIHQNNSEPHHL